ncbi:MAG: ATP-binding protein [Myxococcota bacterium]|nr:ATP-binding protein [Myxococcota bacterium]
MNAFVWLSLFSCVAAAAVASALIAHNAAGRASRLVALILSGSAWWSMWQVLWSVQSDPERVRWMIQASSLGWMFLGALTLHLFAEIQGGATSGLRRCVPWAYACSAVATVLYVGTPWSLGEVVPSRWGWGYRFGPLFPVLFGITVGWIGVVFLAWRSLSRAAVDHERRETRRALVAVSLATAVASFTDVVLPALDRDGPQLGSSAVLALGCVLAWSIRRHGYFLVAPGAFAPEILSSLRDGVALLRPDGRVRTCNEALSHLMQRDPDEILNAPIARFLPGLPGDETLEDAEVELWPADGDPFPVSVSASALRSREGRSLGRVLAIRDLREVTALRKRLVTSGRLAAVGELAAGIAHEIANPVTFVRANLMELGRHWETLRAAAEAEPGTHAERIADEAEELLQESVDGIDRIVSVVRNVGAFSHSGRGRPEPLDLNELLDSVLGIASLSFSVVVERCYGPLPPMLGNAAQLKQAFLNLVLNALQAVGDFGRIRLVTHARGDEITVRVQDDGPGIPSSDIERVFDPFFTTRPGEGLGLGLAQCFQIVRAHGGAISAYSTPGRGAVFEVRLPGADASEA